jgi:hypothetical protein
MSKCKNCGAELSQEIKFCTRCGAYNEPAEAVRPTLDNAVPPIIPVPVQPVAEYAQPRPYAAAENAGGYAPNSGYVPNSGYAPNGGYAQSGGYAQQQQNNVYVGPVPAKPLEALNTTGMLVWAIFTMLCCASPLAMFSIVFAAIAGVEKNYDTDKAKKYLHYAKVLNIVGMIIGLLIVVLYFSIIANAINSITSGLAAQ